MLYYIIAALYVIACLSLMLVVLLQQGKGGDIAAAFGGASSQTAFGARAIVERLNANGVRVDPICGRFKSGTARLAVSY